MKPRDFSHNKTYPGISGNPFDVTLHRLVALQKIIPPVFALVLLFLAFGFNLFQCQPSLVLFSIYLLDWLLLTLLPRFNKSYGPPQPPVLMLAVMRGLVALVIPFWFSLALQILGVFLVIWGFWIEPHRIIVAHQNFYSPKLSPEATVRLLHLGDLHIERITQREKQLEQLIHDLHPDVIVFTGDILNLSYLHDEIAHKHARKIIQQWVAPLGVYAVSGSPAVDLVDGFPNLVADTGLSWLNNQIKTISSGPDMAMRIIGITCTHNPDVDAQTTLSLMSGTNPDTFSILLYHSPDIAPRLADSGIDLQLSGHTHGGQVRLPLLGAIVTGSLYGRAFQAGRYVLNTLTLYITRGIGLEGAAAPRVRFLCPPEVILWEISGKAAPNN